jgi:hypothetical protein
MSFRGEVPFAKLQVSKSYLDFVSIHLAFPLQL